MKIETSCRCGAEITIEHDDVLDCQKILDSFLKVHSYCLWNLNYPATKQDRDQDNAEI